MYYAGIGMLAIALLLIVNHDILLSRTEDFKKPAWKIYRRFLFAVLAYYVTDVLWGTLEANKLAFSLFVDTTVYYAAMAAGVLFWAQYTVTYLKDETAFGKILVYAGRIIAVTISVLALINIFVPVLFTVDAECVYHALPVRYVMLSFQILLLLLISGLSIVSIIRHGKENRQKYYALAFFGLIMGIFLFLQLLHPYLPLYSIAYILGTCLLHTFVIGEEKEDYRRRLEAAYEQQRRSGTVFAHIAMSLARGYTELYYVNMESGEYTEYHTDDGNGVMTEARHGSDFFEACERETKLYVHPDDGEAFAKAMSRESLNKALARNHVFEQTYRRIRGNEAFYVLMNVIRMEDDDRFIVIGVRDIDEQMKQRRIQDRMMEERESYRRIQALTGSFIAMYVVEPETEHYRELGFADSYREYFEQMKEGDHFFEDARKSGRIYNDPNDIDLFLSVFTKENIMAEIERSGIFTLEYRIHIEGKPIHVQLRAAMIEESEGLRLIVGMNNIEAQVRQGEEYRKNLTNAQEQAKIDALTGVKNKFAYLETEAEMNRRIGEHSQMPFAIVIMDINDLKTVNDTLGHQAGDQHLCDACEVICNTFEHSPVFRIGGDEFAVISQGKDYEHIDELIGKIHDHNAKALRRGGVMIACGMARSAEDPSIADVFERADQNMYENKKELKAARESIQAAE